MDWFQFISLSNEKGSVINIIDSIKYSIVGMMMPSVLITGECKCISMDLVQE